MMKKVRKWLPLGRLLTGKQHGGIPRVMETFWILKWVVVMWMYIRVYSHPDVYLRSSHFLPVNEGFEAEAPILWPLDSKSQLTGKDPDAETDWGQEEEGATEDEVVEWHHQLNGHEFEQTLWDSEGQGSLACCSPWSHRVRHNLATEQQILFLVPGPRSLFREAVLDAVSTWYPCLFTLILLYLNHKSRSRVVPLYLLTCPWLHLNCIF